MHRKEQRVHQKDKGFRLIIENEHDLLDTEEYMNKCYVLKLHVPGISL